MVLYHADINEDLLGHLENELGPLVNLKVTPGNYWKVSRNWHHNDDCRTERDERHPVLGFERGSSLDRMILVNRDGGYHHFTKFIIEQFSSHYDDFAYLQVDQHVDFEHQYMHATFVGSIFFDLGIPVYMLAEPVSPDFSAPFQFRREALIKVLRPGAEDALSFDFNKGWSFPKVQAKYVSSIDEKKIYMSTDVDAFSSEFFITAWAETAVKTFTPTRYKELVGEVVKDKKLVGADITGVHTNEFGIRKLIMN